MAVICQHANRLAKKGHELTLISIVDVESMYWFPEQHVPVIHIKEAKSDYDIIVATAWSTASYLMDINSKVKCYFVQSDETRFHEANSRWQHLTTLTYYLGVNYLTEAKWIQRWLKENFGHDSELIPNGLDEKIFHITNPLVNKGRRPRILLEGAIGLPFKGMKEAFEAVKNIDAEIWCVSSYGKPQSDWRCDKFFEHVPMLDMKKIYCSCDVLLKLSRVEGFFGPPMEMMACGGAVVVGRVTGYDEYIVDGENALVVDPFDVDGATQAINKIINDIELRTKLINAGKETAKNWSWDDSVNRLEKYYQKLLAKHNGNKDMRAIYDRSIVYACKMISSRVNESHLDAFESLDEPIPMHIQRLVTYLSKNYFFIKFANSIKLILKIKRIFRKNRWIK
jgi:glycosyltransferase involved in cell wall biosynthesis